MLLRAILACFYGVTAVSGAAHWTRLTATNIDLYTDAGEAAGRRVLGRLEVAREFFSTFRTVPVLVVVFANRKDFQQLGEPPSVQGVYQGGTQRDYIAMVDAGSKVPMHEYVHLLLNHGSVTLPLWLDEGLAEFYSNVTISGSKIVIGSPIATHLETLSRNDWLTAAQLRGVERGASVYNEREKIGVFYAESWLIAHMLNSAPGYRGGMERFATLLAGGEAVDAAFRSAFHKTMDEAVTDARKYMSDVRPVEIAAPAAGEAERAAAVKVVDAAEAAGVRAELLMAFERDEQAAAIYRELAERSPRSPVAETGLGTIALRARDYEEAKRHFERAVELGARDGATCFEYAMLLRETGAPRERVTEMLKKAVELSPALAEAHFLIGVRASDEGDYAQAVEHLRRATEILPRQAYFWRALSFAYHKQGRPAESREAAYRARNAARTEEEKGMAEAALHLSEPERLPPAKPRVTIPKSWDNPQGDARIVGRLTEVQCEGPSARLRVGELELLVQDPRRVVLRGAPGIQTELRCGPQDLQVLVEYDSATKGVTAIEFR